MDRVVWGFMPHCSVPALVVTVEGGPPQPDMLDLVGCDGCDQAFAVVVDVVVAVVVDQLSVGTTVFDVHALLAVVVTVVVVAVVDCHIVEGVFLVDGHIDVLSIDSLFNVPADKYCGFMIYRVYRCTACLLNE